MAVLSLRSWPNLKEAPLLSLRKINGTFLERAKLGRCFVSHRGLLSAAISTAWSAMALALDGALALGGGGLHSYAKLAPIGSVIGFMRSSTRVTSFTPTANCSCKNTQQCQSIRVIHALSTTIWIQKLGKGTNLEPHLFRQCIAFHKSCWLYLSDIIYNKLIHHWNLNLFFQTWSNLLTSELIGADDLDVLLRSNYTVTRLNRVNLHLVWHHKLTETQKCWTPTYSWTWCWGSKPDLEAWMILLCAPLFLGAMFMHRTVPTNCSMKFLNQPSSSVYLMLTYRGKRRRWGSWSQKESAKLCAHSPFWV